MDSDVSLRDVLEADLPIFFAYQLDPDAQAMAAFISKDPANREAFMAHWHRILADPTTINRTIVVDGQLAGSVSSYHDSSRPLDAQDQADFAERRTVVSTLYSTGGG